MLILQDAVLQAETGEECRYQIGVLSCFGSRLFLSLTLSILLVLVGFCSAVGVKMVIDVLREWWVSRSVGSPRLSVTSGSGDAVSVGPELHRSPHLNPFGGLEFSSAPEARGDVGLYEELDLPPSYDEAILMDLPPTYHAAQGLNRVLPGYEEVGRTWV